MSCSAHILKKIFKLVSVLISGITKKFKFFWKLEDLRTPVSVLQRSGLELSSSYSFHFFFNVNFRSWNDHIKKKKKKKKRHVFTLKTQQNPLVLCRLTLSLAFSLVFSFGSTSFSLFSRKALWVQIAQKHRLWYTSHVHQRSTHILCRSALFPPPLQPSGTAANRSAAPALNFKWNQL